MKKESKAILALAAIFLIIIFARPSQSREDLPPEEERSYCKPEERGVDACIELYKPVCGYYGDGETETFSNNCFACMKESVLFWTEGECSGE